MGCGYQDYHLLFTYPLINQDIPWKSKTPPEYSTSRTTINCNDVRKEELNDQWIRVTKAAKRKKRVHCPTPINQQKKKNYFETSQFTTTLTRKATTTSKKIIYNISMELEKRRINPFPEFIKQEYS